MARYIKQPDASELLSEVLKTNPIWRTLAEKVNDLTKVHINQPVDKLANIRNSRVFMRGDYIETPLGKGRVAVVRRQLPTTSESGEVLYEDHIEIELEGNQAVVLPIRNMQERPLMIGNAQMMGFDFYSDELNDQDYQRVMDYVGSYWAHSGTKQFVEFLSFIKNVRFEMWQLWTLDHGDPDTGDTEKDQYRWLERKLWRQQAVWETDSFDMAEPTSVDGTGGVYPTSHVELEYDVITYGTDLDWRSIVQLFYYLAPIHLVLERFVAAVYGKQINTYRGDVASFDDTQFANYTWQPNANINSFGDMAASFDAYGCGFLMLDDEFNMLLRTGIEPSSDGSGVGEVA